MRVSKALASSKSRTVKTYICLSPTQVQFQFSRMSFMLILFACIPDSEHLAFPAGLGRVGGEPPTWCH